MSLSGVVPDLDRVLSWLPDLVNIIDLGLVLALSYALLLIIGEGERRSLWMVRGFIVLMLATVVSGQLELKLLKFLLEKLVLGSAVAMAVIFQSQFRRFLEQIGRGEILPLFQSSGRPRTQPDSVIDRIVEAVKELSQNRTGALVLMETTGSLEEEDFVSPGVSLNAEVSKELLQTIFQTSTLLHDGAVLIGGSRILAAAVILPLSERTASRQLGTRHRAAMGITERIEKCLCIVVSEETGSISLAEKGTLNRPLTSSKLKELLQDRFTPIVERDAAVRLSRKIGFQGKILLERLLSLRPSDFRKKN
ncbi:TIGR00159 family protein [Waterburya agarophytonicola K14]|uniref:Diadenylate cyclase n=1 Tax=Waterburya agarophytonicola KI4 TaxID=2874699 RepID=A0A964BTE0_9CYAN|nr:diadenylate cyclase CdaA [Waterburya agarophytonicola]MCC0177916.1 TIGR00159 family protein [Waterburya agarophytonicola KI4]